METGLASCDLDRLVAFTGSDPYSHTIWPHCGDILSRERVESKLGQGDLLPPLGADAIARGVDLNFDSPSIDDHARRVAWLVARYDPLQASVAINCPPLPGATGMDIVDGHHRLAAALYRGERAIRVHVRRGRLDLLDNSGLILKWLERPATTVFGDNILALSPGHSLGDALVVDQSADAIWISTMEGHPLGRFKHRRGFDVNHLSGETADFGNFLQGPVTLDAFIAAFDRAHQVLLPAEQLV